MVLKINPFYIVIAFVFITLKSSAQPETRPLESHSYLTSTELTKLLTVLESAPLIGAEGECTTDECEKIKIYRNALINLKEDLYAYEDFVKVSATVSKNSWENYLQQTIAINNEDLKGRMEVILAFKDALAKTAALLVDLVDVHNLIFVKKDVSGNYFEKLVIIVDYLDEVLSLADVYFKTTKEDLDTNTLTQTTGNPDFYSGYTTLRGAFNILKESLTNAKEIKAWRLLSASEKLKALDKPSVRNVGAAVVNLLGIYSNYERNLMRDAIKEFEEVLAKNDVVQNQHYDKYKLKMGLLWETSKAINKISLRQEKLRTANLACNALPFTRAERKIIKRDNDTYGEGLRYYKSIIQTAIHNIHLSWKDVKSCSGKFYTMKVYDGIGNQRSVQLEITRNSDKKVIFNDVITPKTKFRLTEDSYVFKLRSGRANDGVRSKEALLSYYIVKGDEKSKHIEVSPYGRVSLKVTDKSGKTVPYRYKIYTRDKKLVDYSFSTMYKEEIMDLPTNTSYILELNYGDDIFKVQTIEGITIVEKKVNKLHYIYDEGKFIEDNTNKTENPTTTPRTPSTQEVTLKQTPVGWVAGVLYNSNDGGCEASTGRDIEFVNHSGSIYNLETGTYSENVVVHAGQRLNVAVLETGGHLRAFTIDPNDVNAKDAYSFWFAENLTKGWWFASGCKDGTKPKTNCNDGVKNQEGVKSYSSCRSAYD